MVYDITEKLQADKLLQESEQKYRQLASQLQEESNRLNEAQAVAKVGSWEIDMHTLNLKWSKETHRIFETDPEQFKPDYNSFLKFVHLEDQAFLEAAFADSLSKGTSASVEHRILTLRGTEKYILENWQVYKDENGVSVRANGTCQDITERRKAEEKLINSEFKLNTAQRIS
jgi:PAS domain S-box-containing protein